MLLSERRGPVLFMTLNRPEVRNAFDEAAVAEITAAFKSRAKDPALRAVVLRGAGKDFCAGADLRWMRRAAALSPAQSRRDAVRLLGMCRAIYECPVPVIARIHGACLGGGVGIASASDIAVAADNAVMAFSECRLGIVPAVISSFVLPKIGLGQARRLFLTAEPFSAGFAKPIGMVHEVAPESDLDPRIEGLLRHILRAAPSAVRKAKAFLRKVADLPMANRLRISTDTLVRVRFSPEAREGFAAFLEKRPPSWIEPS